MMKLVFAAAFATVIGVPEAAAQSLVQRSDWQDRKFETYLPRVNTTVPWLEIDTRTKLPKGDYSARTRCGFGRRTRSAAPRNHAGRSQRVQLWEYVAMQDGKWIELDVRRPGTRRILEALRQIEEEAPGLIDEAALAATELAKGCAPPSPHPRPSMEGCVTDCQARLIKNDTLYGDFVVAPRRTL